MRRSELLNCTWRNVDFEGLAIEVCSKENTAETWEWHVKDVDRRTLPLTKDLVSLLVHHQNKQPEGYPYVFVPVARYDHIQKLRQQGKWKFRHSRLNVVIRGQWVCGSLSGCFAPYIEYVGKSWLFHKQL